MTVKQLIELLKNANEASTVFISTGSCHVSCSDVKIELEHISKILSPYGSMCSEVNQEKVYLR